MGYVEVTQTFGCEIDEVLDQMNMVQFASLCRTWAQETFAKQVAAMMCL
jgi:hypothetical protein